MQEAIAIGISLPKGIITKIDHDRGDISRSRYMLRLLERIYESQESGQDQNVKKQQRKSRRQPGTYTLVLQSDHQPTKHMEDSQIDREL